MYTILSYKLPPCLQLRSEVIPEYRAARSFDNELDYIYFFLNNKRLISFGFLLTFFSSFGQTFLISLYVPDIIREFQMDNSSFGILYGSATILSAFTLAYVGKFIDYFNLRNYTAAAVLLLTVSCLLISYSSTVLVLFIGFWGLRLAGQGLFSHISSTSVARFFNKTRGRALSLSVLGYSIGEGIFPVIVTMLIGLIGWRYSMLVTAALTGMILLPFIVIALNKKEFHRFPVESGDRQNETGFSRSRLFRDKTFYIIALNSFVLPFIITGLFFYQLTLAEEKGWSVTWLSAGFIGYAASRTIFSLISGKLVDRYSANSLLPFYLVPFVAGLSVLILFNTPLAAPLYLSLTGISMGLGSTIITAVLAETYGTGNLGGIRAMFATLMVLSTAASPVLFGFLLDRGMNVTGIAAISLCLVSLAIAVSTRLHPVLKVRFQTE